MGMEDKTINPRRMVGVAEAKPDAVEFERYVPTAEPVDAIRFEKHRAAEMVKLIESYGHTATIDCEGTIIDVDKETSDRALLWVGDYLVRIDEDIQVVQWSEFEYIYDKIDTDMADGPMTFTEVLQALIKDPDLQFRLPEWGVGVHLEYPSGGLLKLLIEDMARTDWVKIAHDI